MVLRVAKAITARWLSQSFCFSLNATIIVFRFLMTRSVMLACGWHKVVFVMHAKDYASVREGLIVK